MEKVTKKDLNERLLMVETLLGLHRVLPEQISNKQANDAIFRMQCALSSGKELAERESKLKVLDQSVFDDEPEQIKWAVVTSEGAVLKFELEPVVKDGLWSWAHGNGCRQHALIGQYDANDWQNSLIERKELTGKALVKAIIENGGRSKVLVRVSSSSEVEFKNWILTFATMEGSEVVTNNSNTWDYMAAIDIEGEPLTATDVGL